MPRKTRSAKRKAPVSPSERSKRKLATIAEGAAEERTVEELLTDFEIRSAGYIKQFKKRFESEAKKMLVALPMKSSLPKEVVKMTVQEFIQRGGNFPSVLESLKKEKISVPAPEGTAVSQSSASLLPSGGKDDTEPTNTTAAVLDPAFVTPAMNLRSKPVTRPEYTNNITKRKPQPLEHVAMMTWSKQSGSPVDEETFMQLQLDQCMETVKGKIMEDMSMMPQKWRTHILKTLKKVKADTMKQDPFVTPFTRR